MADTIRDGYYEETSGYIPIRPTNVEKYVRTDPKDYIISPEELKKILTSGGTGGTEHDAEQDRKLKDLLGLTDDGKLALNVAEGSAVNSNMNISEAVSALANESADNKQKIDVINGDEDTEGSIKNIVNEKLSELIDGAPETLDTLKEIADWINNDHNDLANNILSKIDELVAKDAEVDSELNRIDSSLREESSIRESQDEALKELISQEKEDRAISITALQTTLSSNLARLDATDNELVRLIGIEQGKNQANKDGLEELRNLLETEESNRETANDELKALIECESTRAKDVENTLATQISVNWGETVQLVNNLSTIHTQHVGTLVQAIQNLETQHKADNKDMNDNINDLEGRVRELEIGIEGGEFTI